MADDCVLPHEDRAVEHRRVAATLDVGEQLRPREVPLGVVTHETCVKEGITEKKSRRAQVIKKFAVTPRRLCPLFIARVCLASLADSRACYRRLISMS